MTALYLNSDDRLLDMKYATNWIIPPYYLDAQIRQACGGTKSVDKLAVEQ